MQSIQNTNTLVVDTFVCLLFFNAQYIQLIPVLAFSSLILKLMLTIVFCSIVFIRKIYLDKITLLLVLIAFLVIISSIIYADKLYLPLQRYYGIIAIFLFVTIRRNNLRHLYYAIFISSGVLIVANVISMFIFPSGIYVSEENMAPYWILGQKQDFASVYLVFLLISFLLWKDSLKIRIAIILINGLMFLSVTMVVALGLALCLFVPILLITIHRLTHIHIKSITLFLYYIFGEFLLVALALISKKFAFLFVFLEQFDASNQDTGAGAFTKADSLYTRINMWYDAILLIIKNPMGVGIMSEGRFGHLMRNSTYHPHVHNTILDITLTGGWLALVLFVTINVIVCRRLDKVKNADSVVFRYFIFGMNLLMLTECTYWPFFLVLYIFAYYTSKYEMINNIKVKVIGSKLSLKEGMVVKLTKYKRN